jgi:hypothetical protein
MPAILPRSVAVKCDEEIFNLRIELTTIMRWHI